MASTPYSDIALPKEVTDPLYTSSQAGLNTLGTELTTGQDIPDYYKSIGDFNSPQFQAMLNSVKGQVMQGSQESSAINGTARSGVATTASNNALNSVIPQLTYADYTRALQGRGALLDTGINVQGGVRQSAQNQQQFDTNFNQTLFNDKVGLASAMDSWKKQAAAAQGQQIGNTISGFTNGGLFGAASGYFGGPTDTSSFGGGGGTGGIQGLSSLFSSLGSQGGIQTGGNSLTSSLGSFGGGTGIGTGTAGIDSLFQAGVPLSLAAV